jgi:hypothetical protein
VVVVLYGNGNGTFQNPQYFAAGFGLRSLSISEVNGDGEQDIVTADELFVRSRFCFGSSSSEFASAITHQND